MAGSPRILVADDDRALCKMIAAALRTRGLEPQVRFDGESAVAAIARERFDLLVCDFMLPGISGLDVVAQIRATETICDLPIVLMSSHVNHGIRGRALHAGADAFLGKPFSLAQLRTTVATLLERPRLKAVSNI